MKLFDSIKKTLPRFKKRRSTHSFISTKMWTDSSKLTTDVYDELYERLGVAHKIVTRLSDDRFDRWFSVITESEEFKDRLDLLNSSKKEGLNIRNNQKIARKYAMRHGFSVIFFQYNDQAKDISEPVLNPRFIEKIKVITRDEINDIELDTNSDSETFGEILFYHLKPEVFNSGYDDIKVHASRCIHVMNDTTKDPNGISLYKPMYNWLNIFDNTAWSIGQSFFRYAGGFPVLTVKGWDALSNDEQDDYTKQWENVNSMTGFVTGDGYTVDFKGAEGRALSPKEYFEAGLSLIAAAGDLPYSLLIGVNAGAVSGSETNLKDYYSDISSKQKLEEQPILEETYDKLMETGQLPKIDYEIEWIPLFSETNKEVAETEKLEAETLEIQKRTGIITKDNQDKIDNGDLIEVETSQEPQPTSNFPETQTIEGQDAGFSCECIKCDYKTTSEKHCADIKCPKCGGQMRRAERPGPGQDASIKKKTKIKRKTNLKSKFGSPYYRKLEDSYFKELDKVFKEIEVSIIQVAKGFNADSKDVLNEKDFGKMQNSIDNVFKINNKRFRPIVKANIDNSINEGIKSASGELKIDLNVPQKQVNAKLNVIGNEHEKVVSTLSDDIAKDISTKLGIVTLNPVKGFAEIEKLIKDSFSSRKAQLKMGVGNELNSSLNQGNLLGYDESGIVVGKEWVAFVDANTTNTCLSLNGEVVPIGESFSSGDYAPPAMDPPHPCRSSLRGITATEAQSPNLNLSDEIRNLSDRVINRRERDVNNQLDNELRQKNLDIVNKKNKLITDLQADIDGRD